VGRRGMSLRVDERREVSPQCKSDMGERGMSARRAKALTGACAVLGAATVLLLIEPPPPPPLFKSAGLRRFSYLLAAGEETDEASCGPRMLDRGLAVPTGAPTALSCDEARIIIAQARATIAGSSAPIEPAKFAEATSDWLDPHGLWSVAPDAPVGLVLRQEGELLLSEIQQPPGTGGCRAAERVGASLAQWSSELLGRFENGYREGFGGGARPSGLDREAWSIASSTPFEDGTVTRSARELARTLGRDAGSVRALYGEAVSPYVEAARGRMVPKLDAEAWSRVVIAAALRAYIPQLDAHGAWAPLDEEISLYDLSLETSPPERLWSEMTRTAIGVRIDRGALAPLAEGDVVLRVHDVPVAGMSVEQAEQLSIASDAHAGSATHVTVLRAGSTEPLDLVVHPGPEVGEGAADDAEPHALSVDFVAYAGALAAVITVPDVPDDLGPRMEDAVTRVRHAGDVRGILLDVRANGGGSTDGAIAALGVFLPSASLFPMKRRDGGIEVESAPDVPPERRWAGPLAVLVDGDSASAAEMIAGALASYRRGVVVGDKTYGKGCAQEYLDDEAHVGVLRLTTLLYCLPDGSPVQKVGIQPQIRLTLPGTNEKESMVTRALGPWRGPDVRDASRVREVPWGAHGGRVGPCKDETICRALRAVGAVPAAAR
jgi:carboxyl-terminal processing protease